MNGKTLIAAGVILFACLPATGAENDDAVLRDRYLVSTLNSPRHGTAVERLYQLAVQTDGIDALVKQLGAARAGTPDAKRWTLAGLLQEMRGRDVQALAAFERAAAVDARAYYPRYARGLILLHRNDYRHAIESLLAALKIGTPRAGFTVVDVHRLFSTGTRCIVGDTGGPERLVASRPVPAEPNKRYLMGAWLRTYKGVAVCARLTLNAQKQAITVHEADWVVDDPHWAFVVQQLKPGGTFAGASTPGKPRRYARSQADRMPKAQKYVRVGCLPEGAVAFDDAFLVEYSMAEAKLLAALAVLQPRGRAAVTVAFSPDGTTLAAGGRAKDGNGEIKFWNVATRKLAGTIHTSNVNAIAFSPDGKTLAVGTGADNQPCEVTLWNTRTRQQAVLAGHGQGVTSVAFAPDGAMLATGDKDKKVRLWDIAAAQERGTLPGHLDTVTAVAFFPDGKTLATGSRDGTVKLWNLVTRGARSTFHARIGTVRCIAVGPDGATLGAGGASTTIRLWRTTFGVR